MWNDLHLWSTREVWWWLSFFCYHIHLQYLALMVFAKFTCMFSHIQEEEQRISEMAQQKKQGISLGTIAGRFWSRKQQWRLVLLAPTRNRPAWTVSSHWDEGHSRTGGRCQWAHKGMCGKTSNQATLNRILGVWKGVTNSKKTFHSCERWHFLDSRHTRAHTYDALMFDLSD